MKRLLAIDLDGTLTENESWTCPECLTANPRTDVIDYVNSLYGKNVIIIYTSRGEKFRNETEYWLKVNGVKYHALRMDKMGADCYLDDKSVKNLIELKDYERKQPK